MNSEGAKVSVTGSVDAIADDLNKLSLKIHANPELGFHETKAVAWITEYLEQNDFSVEKGICDLPTAFRASYGRGNPRIAIIAEYDALPKLGHACGHNLIAASAVGSAMASRPTIDRFGGTVCVIGTPAEEIYGGKILMAERGAFEGFDAAIMVHPGTHDTVLINALACQSLEVEFFGKPAHAAAQPESGINALDAMIQSYNAINSLRQHLKDGTRIHGIIPDGGEAANIVPAHSAGLFMLRTRQDSYLDDLKRRVIDCFVCGATATGARFAYRWGDVRYGAMRNNLALADLFKRNMEMLGRTPKLALNDTVFGSTDMGNVSSLVPSIHPEIAITSEDVALHSPEFTSAARSESGRVGLLDGAKALAMTVFDLLSNPDAMKLVKHEFQQGSHSCAL